MLISKACFFSRFHQYQDGNHSHRCNICARDFIPISLPIYSSPDYGKYSDHYFSKLLAYHIIKTECSLVYIR